MFLVSLVKMDIVHLKENDFTQNSLYVCKNKSDLLFLFDSYKKKLKGNKFEKEEYGQKSYLKTTTQSRTFFSCRSIMLTFVRLNFKTSDPVFAANEYKWESQCRDLDTQANLLTCRLYIVQASTWLALTPT